ncbi:alpha/beta hydrolase [Cryobacterium adonitolivorans]|uniref:Alpha/beta hydrolase n=1 Tax=Cryobacterium adonitolivorans TaxID=1259189 RepID=A0A4R8W525_9MICO|nr:alpha/beta fold hydrolase [Cryobacterium adonitolivorans]TFC01032.1 alpha/beta hydrolase [Cryobacterium adonitolivorans]
MDTNQGDVTVALVHGAFADSASWADAISELHATGISSVAISNPLRGLTHDVAAHPPTLLGRALKPRTYPNGAEPAPELYIEQAAFHQVFAGDLPASRVAPMSVSQRPVAAGAFTESLTGEPAWKSLPSWFVIATADNAIHPDSQRANAERMNATVVEIAGSHAVTVSNPADVAAVITAAVATARATEELVSS